MIDTAIKLKALQERFKSETETIYLKALEEALENILGKLALKNKYIETRRLKTVKKAIENEISQIYASLQKPLQIDTKEFTSLAYTTQAKVFGIAATIVPSTLVKKIIDLDRIVLMGDRAFTISELLKTSEANQIRRVKEIMSAGIVANSGYKEIVERIKETIPTSQREIRAIVHTSIATAKEEASMELEKDFLHVIIGWRSVATLDSRTSLICATLDGKKYLKSKYPNRKSVPNRPPRHFNCRSVIVPITKYDQLVKRPSKGDKRERVSAKTTFKDWFNRQSPKFQKEYLGPARYKLFKENRLTLNSFVDIKTGRPLTLNEIKELL